VKNYKPGKKIVKSLKVLKNHKKNETVKIRRDKIRNGTNSKKNHNEHKNKTVKIQKRNNKTFVKDHVERKNLKHKVDKKEH
jgi:hypothetical protein